MNSPVDLKGILIYHFFTLFKTRLVFDIVNYLKSNESEDRGTSSEVNSSAQNRKYR